VSRPVPLSDFRDQQPVQTRSLSQSCEASTTAFVVSQA
jgi:hypothetical protein